MNPEKFSVCFKDCLNVMLANAGIRSSARMTCVALPRSCLSPQAEVADAGVRRNQGKTFVRHFLSFFGALLLWGSALAADRPPGHAVASAHPLATQAGVEILQAGGNAFDAAVAVSAALSVVEPAGSGIGGGGFWLLHRESDGLETFVDGRETAPREASARMYLNADGKADAALSTTGALAAAIPAQPAAFDYVARKYGTLPLKQLLAPAIRYAREGFVVDAKLARMFAAMWPRFSIAAMQAFTVEGHMPATGDVLRQPELAHTLELLAESGRAGFYEGEIAEKLLAGVRAEGGIWTQEDLRRYRVVERQPLVTWFRNYRVVTAPPPSAGGMALAQMFNQLEALGWRGDASLQSRHLVIEAWRRAYRDRAAYLGDPDFVSIPLYRLLSRSYALGLARSISRQRATPSRELPPTQAVHEGSNTSHFSIVDAQGNRIAVTQSINLPFGSALMAPGTGVLLNDEMDDFAAAVDASNAYGLVGSVANSIAPGKRPLSSMTPSFVEGPQGLLVIGTPGGSRIITMVALGILNWTQGMSAAQLVAAPRYHHQYLPDEIQFEPGAFSDTDQALLGVMGHTLAPLSSAYGNMQAVWWDKNANKLEAASDPRGVGLGTVVITENANTPR